VADLPIKTDDPVTNLLSPSVRLFTAPNPAHRQTDVFYSLGAPAVAGLQIVDLAGETIRIESLGQQDPGTYRHHLDLSRLAPGIYFVVLSVQEDQKPMERIIFKLALLP
jgi:hypothetical protein